jgi:hypothetical protein
MTHRVTLIHALKHSIAPIEAAFARLWPEARLMNLLDDSLSADLARTVEDVRAATADAMKRRGGIGQPPASEIAPAA